MLHTVIAFYRWLWKASVLIDFNHKLNSDKKEKNSTLDEAVSQLKLQKKMKIWHAEGDQFMVPGKWASMFQASPLETVTALHGYRALTLGGGVDQQVVSNRKSV